MTQIYSQQQFYQQKRKYLFTYKQRDSFNHPLLDLTRQKIPNYQYTIPKFYTIYFRQKHKPQKMILQRVNQKVNRQQYLYAAVVLLNPHKHYPRFQAQCSNMLEEKLERTFKLIRYSFLQKSTSEEKLKLKPKPIQKSPQKLKSQRLKLRQAYLIYHNHSCEIIHGLIKRQLDIYASVIPFSKYMCLHYGPTKKTTKQVKNELRTKLIPFRWFDKGLQDEFNLSYDQQDRTIQGYFKLLQEGFNMEFCKENWEKLKERIFRGEQKTYRYVKRVYWNFEN